jgi:hypothetical protein
VKTKKRILHRTAQNGRAARDQPTQEYGAFEQAFDFFNAELFEGKLSPVLITLTRKTQTRGYYSAKKFETRDAKAQADEIALNPVEFRGRTDEQILSTLVHEMTHHWQHQFGKPSRGRYHNAEWADKTETLGLMPSDTGLPGGGRRGQAMTHYILDDGPFARACKRLLDGGFVLTWQDPGTPRATQPGKNKVKFTCSQCGQNAWAKPGTQLVCAACCWNMGESGEESSPYRPLTWIVRNRNQQLEPWRNHVDSEPAPKNPRWKVLLDQRHPQADAKAPPLLRGVRWWPRRAPGP